MIQDAIKYICWPPGLFEIEERDRAIRLYQIVLGLDPSHPAAVRELTNLEAPLVGIRNEAIEPPTPRPEKVSASEAPASGAREGGSLAAGLVARGDDAGGGGGRSGMLSRTAGAGAPKAPPAKLPVW